MTAHNKNQTSSKNQHGFTDIRSTIWLDRVIPEFCRPYLRLARLDRPIGIWLLLFPCWWSVILASTAHNQYLDVQLMLLFALGAIVMRGAGCTINDILDRNIDAQVERTRSRPLPSGQISLRQAMIFLALLLTIGLIILLQFNTLSILLGAVSVVLIIMYPMMKHITWWPQLFLGLTFNWGALLGWTAQTNSLALPAILLYAGCITWTIGYDTIYAHQDKEDDQRIGIKSTALLLGHHSHYWITGFYSMSMILWLLAGLFSGLGIGFGGSLCAVAVLFFQQLRHWNPDDPNDCLERFRTNRLVGLVLLIGLLIDNAMID